VKQMEGVTIRVIRGDEPEWFHKAVWLNKQPTWMKPIMSWMLPEVTSVHVSERDWIGWEFDYTIHNDGDLLQLHAQIDQIMEQIDKLPG